MTASKTWFVPNEISCGADVRYLQCNTYFNCCMHSYVHCTHTHAVHTALVCSILTDARCLGVSRQKQLAECTPLTRIEKQRAPNGDKEPDTEQWKFAQRHPLLLSDCLWRGQHFVLIPQLG